MARYVMTEDSINNSYQIEEEFKCARLRKSFYHAPLPRKKQRVQAEEEKNGPVKVYSEEELFLFKMKRYRPLNN